MKVNVDERGGLFGRSFPTKENSKTAKAKTVAAKMEKNGNEHWGPCRIASEAVYTVCRLLRVKGECRINILQYMRGEEIRQRGHAWVTLGEKDLFLTPAHRPESMVLLGGNGKYRYWVSVKEGRPKGL